jgi:adenylate cyclase
MVIPQLALRGWGLAFGVPLCITLLGLAIACVPFVERLELTWLDNEFQVLRDVLPRSSTQDIAIIGIDERSISEAGMPLVLWHRQLDGMLQALALARPRAVAVDIVLPQNDYANLLPGGIEDLARALIELRTQSPVILATAANADGTLRLPHPLFSAVAGAAGAIVWLVDSDGYVRRFDEALGQNGAEVPTFAGVVARTLGATPRTGIIDYSFGKPFSYTPAWQVAAWLREGNRSTLATKFGGKLVFIGVVLPYEDRVRQPVNLAAWENTAASPGVLLNAQAVRSLVAGRMITPLPWAGRILALVISFWLWGVRSRAWLLVLSTLVATGVAVGGGVIALRGEMWIAVMPALITAVIAIALVVTTALWRHFREQLRLRQLFSGYVSPAILDTILEGRLERDFGGRRIPLTFLFADIRGFTKFSAERPPEVVIDLLNRYFTVMTRVVHDHGGTVDKFRGDGLLAFFGAPAPLENHNRSGVMAALGMLRGLKSLNEELSEDGMPPIAIGIGIAQGEAVIGNIGSPERHDYTVIGAGVNLAAHIQEYCKEVSYGMLVEQEAFVKADLSDADGSRFLDLGERYLHKHGSVRLYAAAPIAV